MEKSDKEKYTKVSEIYEKTKSLIETGRRLGLSRERVRQILVEGQEKGVIQYNPSNVPHEQTFPALSKKFPKTKVIEFLRQCRNLSGVFKELGVNQSTGLAFLKHYGITRADYQSDRSKDKYMKQYMDIVDKLGYHPSTTELLEINKGLYTAICKFWGGIEQFRAEFGVKKEGRHFVNKETYVRWLKSKQKAKVTKAETVNEHKRNIVRLLKNNTEEFMTRNDFEKVLSLSPAMVSRYLLQLTKEQVLKVVALDRQFYYSLNQDSSNYPLYLDEEVGAGERES